MGERRWTGGRAWIIFAAFLGLIFWLTETQQMRWIPLEAQATAFRLLLFWHLGLALAKWLSLALDKVDGDALLKRKLREAAEQVFSRACLDEKHDDCIGLADGRPMCDCGCHHN